MQPRYDDYYSRWIPFDKDLDEIKRDREARIVHTGKKGVVDAKVKKPFYRKGERW